jgi:hypothetical protein
LPGACLWSGVAASCDNAQAAVPANISIKDTASIFLEGMVEIPFLDRAVNLFQ